MKGKERKDAAVAEGIGEGERYQHCMKVLEGDQIYIWSVWLKLRFGPSKFYYLQIDPNDILTICFALSIFKN